VNLMAVTVNDVTKTLKDAALVVIGFGVIAWNKSQVQRRELEKQFEVQTTQLREQFAKVATEVEERSKPVVEAVEASLDQLEERLPEQAREYFKQARTTAKEASDQLRSRWSDTTSTKATTTKKASAAA
jgi:hypothetical protein